MRASRSRCSFTAWRLPFQDEEGQFDPELVPSSVSVPVTEQLPLAIRFVAGRVQLSWDFARAVTRDFRGEGYPGAPTPTVCVWSNQRDTAWFDEADE